MAFKRPLPEWNNPGIEPPQSKKDMGWLGREKPPAQWHNWFQHLTYEALKELQASAAHVTFGVTAPTSPDVNDLWVDTSGSPVLVLKAWNGAQWITVGAVNSVNGKTGDVELTAEDVGAASLTDFNEHLRDKLEDGVHGLATTQDMTLYVDATNGDDSNDGLTPQTAFRTIQKAIDSLPKYIAHSVVINVAPGDYSNEDVDISGFIGNGSIQLLGDTVVPDTRVVDRIHSRYSTVSIHVMGFRCLGIGKAGAQVGNCVAVTFEYLKIDNQDVQAGVYVNAGKVFVRNSTISNRGTAIYAIYLSEVSSINNTGTNNSTVLRADASVIRKGGTQPSGTTQEIILNGGQIL